MIIGIDLDTTLLNKSSLLEITSKDLGYNFIDKDITDWNLNCLPFKLKNEIFKRFRSSYYMCNENIVKPVKGSRKKLLELKKENHKLILISARVKEIRRETKKMVKKLFPKFNKIVFVNMGESKKRYLKNNKIEVWIDDNPKDCKIAVNMNIKTFLISNNYTKYNWHLKKYKNINVVEDITKVKV